MAPFLDLSRLSFEIWKATRHLLDVRLALFFGPLAHAPSDVGLDQGNHWYQRPLLSAPRGARGFLKSSSGIPDPSLQIFYPSVSICAICFRNGTDGLSIAKEPF